MNTKLFKEIEAIQIHSGLGDSIEEACLMQMVAYVAGEGIAGKRLTDHPECTCPILTEYAIGLNDRFNGEHRQLLKPFIPLLVGTRANDETQIARRRLIMWRSVTASYPLILDQIKLSEYANFLRSIPNSIEGMQKAKEFLKEKVMAIGKAANAAVGTADAYTYAHAYAGAHGYAYAYAYAHADAYTDAYAYAYADAHDFALRASIAEIALETLRMAIEVKR